MSRKKLVFHGGRLAERFPDGLEVCGESAAECLGALRMYPGLDEGGEAGLIPVFLPDYGSKDALYDKTDRQEIHVHSFEEGGGGKMGNFLMITIGIVLIAFAQPIAAALPAALGATASGVATFGAMLILQSVISLLMPQPDPGEIRSNTSEEPRSNYLPANQNTVKSGTRIPLLYGRAKAYGHILSFQVTSTNMWDPVSVIPPAIPGVLSLTAGNNYGLNVYDYTDS